MNYKQSANNYKCFLTLHSKQKNTTTYKKKQLSEDVRDANLGLIAIAATTITTTKATFYRREHVMTMTTNMITTTTTISPLSSGRAGEGFVGGETNVEDAVLPRMPGRRPLPGNPEEGLGNEVHHQDRPG